MLPRAVDSRPSVELQVRRRVVGAGSISALGRQRDEQHAGVNAWDASGACVVATQGWQRGLSSGIRSLPPAFCSRFDGSAQPFFERHDRLVAEDLFRQPQVCERVANVPGSWLPYPA